MPADSPAGAVPALRSSEEGHRHGAAWHEGRSPTGPGRLPAAVLWDMDGTLIDSERLWDVALQETARELGGTFGAAARDALVGADVETSIVVLLGEVGRPATPGLVARTRRALIARTVAQFRNGVDWRPGARAALHTVRAAGLRSALVTNSMREIAELALDGIGRAYFDVTVCGDEVAAGKPEPEPYLRAAQLLGVAPADCVAVEDSPNGALAAERAGAAVLVVPSEVPVPGGPRRVHRDGLVGLTTAELAGVVHTVAGCAAPAHPVRVHPVPVHPGPVHPGPVHTTPVPTAAAGVA
jgi:HAD superfamily hydrolase (TIGR01509 family)